MHLQNPVAMGQVGSARTAISRRRSRTLASTAEKREIRVAAQGVPSNEGPRPHSFLYVAQRCKATGGIRRFGARKGRNPRKFETILSGDLNGDDKAGCINIGDNSYHVITAVNASGSTLLEGFTICGGNADGPKEEGKRSDQDGGGVYLLNSQLTIRDCIIQGNCAT